MAYVPKEGSGTLFTNHRKTEEKHPDWQGSIMVNGKDHWLSAWIKKGAKGDFLSVSIGNERLPNDVPKPAEPKQTYLQIKDDEMPF